MVAMNATEEPGTLVYNVYFNDDETLFTYLETYSDSETGLFHAGRFAEGEYVGRSLSGLMAVDFVSMVTSRTSLKSGQKTMDLNPNISV